MNQENINKVKKSNIFILVFGGVLNVIKLKITEHRSSKRDQISLKTINFSILISLLPFIIGFNQFLQTYYINNNKLFLSQNLPGLFPNFERLNWETVQYLIDNQINDIDINWTQNSLLIKPNNNNKRLFTSTYNFKSYIFNQQTKTYNSIFYNKVNKDYLDILPFKLETFNSKFTNNISFTNIPIQTNYQIESDKYYLDNNTNQLSDVPSKLELIGIRQLSDKLTKENLEFRRTDISEKNILIGELINLLNNNLVIPNQFKLSTNFKEGNFDLKVTDLNSFIQILQTVDKKLISNSFIENRLMSGYIYPDINLQKLQYYLNTDENITNQLIKIDLPFSYLQSDYISKSFIPAPKFLIETNLMEFDENSPFQLFYNGPGVLFDKQTGFDWKFSNIGEQESIRKWLINNLNVSNSVENFFGLFESPDSVSNYLSSHSKNEISYWLNNLKVFQTGNFINSTKNNLKFNEILQFPYLNNMELNSTLNSLTEQITTLPLPLIQSRISSFKNTNFIINKSITKNFLFDRPINNKYTYSTITPQISTYLDLDYSTTILSSGYYRSTPSILTIDEKETFFTNLWEPLTFQSWLVTTQIGFAFLTFRTLKALADNYGRELLVYLLDLVALLGFVDEELKQEIELLMGQKEKGFRIIKQTNQNFNNIGGIKKLIPDIIEIVWFLRNSGRNFSLSKIIPRGILLTGPPGTGKTLLVQAIAGEADVPVVALSGSSLLEPGESGALKLQLVFQEARQLAPCIVFIDEIDTLAQKREQVLQNPMGADEILESLSIQNNQEIKTENSGSDVGQQEMYKEKLRILMQFLVELDGIQNRSGVIVIGATNRPEILDPAVLRPGRFDRILELGLPEPEKRYEILNLYSKNLGVDTKISWDYIVDRTIGYSAADLASIMNQSTLNAILNNTNHTLETIEFGIDRTTTIGFEMSVQLNKLTLNTIQLAYYQAGKLLISLLLDSHPDVLVTHLWPRRANIRALQVNKNLQTYFFQFAQRQELEERIIGCYGGKAAEVLFLQTIQNEINLSDLGIEDIQFGQSLIQLMIEKWYLYGNHFSIQQITHILDDINVKEYYGQTEKIEYFNTISNRIETSLEEEIEQFTNSVPDSETETLNREQAQSFFATAIWQSEISTEFEFSSRLFTEWYRLYLPDPQQIDRNLEWIPPDEFFHKNSLKNEFSAGINWNDFSQLKTNYQLNSLMLQSYNQAIILINNNRELLDLFVFKLLKDEILRKPDIDNLIKKSKLVKKKYTKKIDNKNVDSTWGLYSRKKMNKKVTF